MFLQFRARERHVVWETDKQFGAASISNLAIPLTGDGPCQFSITEFYLEFEFKSWGVGAKVIYLFTHNPYLPTLGPIDTGDTQIFHPHNKIMLSISMCQWESGFPFLTEISRYYTLSLPHPWRQMGKKPLPRGRFYFSDPTAFSWRFS